jgi:hypothetical protein
MAYGSTDTKESQHKSHHDILDKWFIKQGFPVSIRTEGGPQFRGPFKSWCAQHHIHLELASAYHHESKGHAECAVKEVKKLLAKTPTYEAFRRALRSYRNCPRYDSLSPAQCSGPSADNNEQMQSHSRPHMTAYRMTLSLNTRPGEEKKQENCAPTQTNHHAKRHNCIQVNTL